MSDLTQEELRATPLELFFDLVFVFSITQVARVLADDPTGEGLIGALLVLLLVWWAWSQYTWALNSLGNEATPIKLALIVAMGAVLFMALAVPDAAGDGGLWFAVGYTAVLLLGLLVYTVGLPRERLPDLARYAVPALIGVLTVLVGGFVEGEARLVVWGIGIFTLGHIPLIAGVVLYAVAAEEAVAHPTEPLESYGRAVLALGVALVVAGFAWDAFRSERFVTWERIVAGAVAIVAVLALRDLSGGIVLWLVAVLIGAALLAEGRRARGATASLGSRVG